MYRTLLFPLAERQEKKKKKEAIPYTQVRPL